MSSASIRDVLILGAGFGGLELATRLSGRDDVRVTLIDRSDGFTFGFSKFDILFGHKTAEQVKLPYASISKPGVEFRQEEIVSIDPRTRAVRTDANSYAPDLLVVALGADYEPYDGHEFYSVAGAERLREVLPTIERGIVEIGVLSVPFKCPPAPFEAAFLMHDYFVERGVRDSIEMRITTPMPAPIPPSPQASKAIVDALTERGISLELGHRPNPEGGQDYFIAIPVHKAPDVVQASGLTEGGTDGWVKVDPRNLRTPFDGVYALGDCADAPVPRAGTLAENAARAVADDIAGSLDTPYEGRGICFVEFGRGEIGMVNVDFLTGPKPAAPLVGPSRDLMAHKNEFGAERRRRWFGL
jgi:sulfide:quinone oxidoreductase